MIKKRITILAILASLIGCADTTLDTSNNLSVSLSDFKPFGTAFFDERSALQLTTYNNTLQRGYAYIDSPIAIDSNTSFEVQFTYSAHIEGGSTRLDYAANGVAFFIQNDPLPMATTANAVDRHYNKLENGFGIFISEFPNNGTADPTGDFVRSYSVNEEFNIIKDVRLEEEITTRSETPRYVWVDYSGENNTLSFYQSEQNVKPASPVLESIIDIFSITGDIGYIGVSADTGAPSVHTATHTILEFSFKKT